MKLIGNVKILPLDLRDPEHYSIFSQIYNHNRKFILDDSINGCEALANELQYDFTTGSVGFLVMVNNKPYGILYAHFDRYNNANIHGSTLEDFNNLHFYTTQRFLNIFIKVLFEKYKVNKVKCEIPIYNNNAEAALRYAGLKKEGQLIGEMRINKKPITTLLLGITKENYFNKTKDKENIKKVLKMIDPENRRKFKR